MPRLHMPRRCLHQMLIIYGLIFVSSATTLDQMPLLPDQCDSVKCPPDAEMHCPADSAVRENLIAVELIKSNAVELPNDSLVADDRDKDKDTAVELPVSSYYNSTISESDYQKCCLPRKCVCKTCYIPDCNEDEVVAELVPENMQLPGQCCGTYECRAEPNCTKVLDTEFMWLKDCQRCKCNSGFLFCHQSCDEQAGGGVCESKIPGIFYKDGDTWTDGCQECECVKGESKCAMSFCGNLNCPSERQVTLKDTCCPVCWPSCAPMPHDSGYRDYTEEESQELDQDQEQDSLPPLLGEPQTITTTTTSTTPTTQTSAEQKADLIAISSPISSSSTSTSTTTAPPGPITICQSAFDQTYNYFYGLLTYSVVATIIISVLSGYIYMQRAKKRSYDPVSSLDHSI
ncbi:cysteine-rich motor neuron 1 protein [Drosophila serrata]|uniref:cysteine-rich motor neuron 1 protein n=1 Tax=Drosophila serrata TaxID=7274 RepID=UPI000A1D2CD1|nr:cysteine-rich motor neuron 1 protein [Drosophila serrata]